MKQDDYLFYALSRPLLEYVREAAVVGVATFRGTGHERLRYWSLLCVAVAALAEAYYVLTAKISLVSEPGDAAMVSQSFSTSSTTKQHSFRYMTMHY